MRRAALASLCLLGLQLGCAASATKTDKAVTKEPPKEGRRDLLMTAEDCTHPPRDTVSRAGALADLAVMERVLLEGWAGLEVRRAEGVDVPALFAALRADLEAQPDPLPVDTFQDLAARRLVALQDNHMALYRMGEKGWSRYRGMGVEYAPYTSDLRVDDQARVLSGYADKGATLLGCEGQSLSELLRPTLTADLQPARLAIVLSATPPTPLRCEFTSGQGTVHIELPLHRLRSALSARDPGPAFELTRGRIPELRIRTFSSTEDASLSELVRAAAELRSTAGFVVDVRGNHGGSDSYAGDFFVELTRGALRYAQIEELSSEVVDQGALNVLVCDLADPSLDASARAKLQTRYEGALAALSAPPQERAYRTWTPTDEGKADKAFTAPIVVLVDKQCGSACESFLQYARQLPGTILVGENSTGVGVFGEQRQYRLPNSGLGFAAGSKYFHDGDPRRVAREGYGHMPDYWLDDPDPMSVARGLAARPGRP